MVRALTSGSRSSEPVKSEVIEDPSASPSRTEPRHVLKVKNLTTLYPVMGGVLRCVVANAHAVEDMSFSINVGQTFSLVGESGCGQIVLRPVDPAVGRTAIRRDLAQRCG
jgi:ABC-type glutathione transport system ATPase component